MLLDIDPDLYEDIEQLCERIGQGKTVDEFADELLRAELDLLAGKPTGKPTLW